VAKSAFCVKCGSSEVFWYQNRNQKWVLCERKSQDYEFGKGGWTAPHYCDGNGFSVEEMIQSYESCIEAIFNQQFEDFDYGKLNGQLKSLRSALKENVPSIPVEVFKGRKVPVGTVGEISWVGIDQFANVKVGIKDAQGEVHFTAVSNVKLVEFAEKAGQ
jgi:hypothetical protein